MKAMRKTPLLVFMAAAVLGLGASDGSRALETPRTSDVDDAHGLSDPTAADDTTTPTSPVAQEATAPSSPTVPTTVPTTVLTRSSVTVPAPPPADRRAALEALDLSLIQSRTSASTAQADAFGVKSWTVAPTTGAGAAFPPPPAPPPPPRAPPLPFKYMGSMQESPQCAVWYLTEGEQLHVIAAGETIGAWRVDGLRGGQLELTYVPRACSSVAPWPSERCREPDAT